MDKTLKQVREKLMIGKCELARKAGVSRSTIHRLEKAESCRPETKKKIVEALGFNPWLNTLTARNRKGHPKIIKAKNPTFE